jgi:hypothetical protein
MLFQLRDEESLLEISDIAAQALPFPGFICFPRQDYGIQNIKEQITPFRKLKFTYVIMNDIQRFLLNVQA